MRTLTLAAAAAALLLGLPVAAPVRAQDDNDPAEAERQRETEQKEKVELIKEKMKYFQSHVGEWVGEEHYEVPGTPFKESTKDEWKGIFALDGTHFEMHGRGESDRGVTTYKWVCTYDADEEVFRAWYFDSKGGHDTFEMEWNKEEKTLVWMSDEDEDGTTSTFRMKVEGNEITGSGSTMNEDGDEIVKHTMNYKKKRVQI